MKNCRLILPLFFLASGCHQPVAEVVQMSAPGIVNLKRADDIFISGAVDNQGLDYIKSEGVTEIIDLRRDEEVDPEYVKAVQEAGIGYHHLPMMSNGLADEQANQFLAAMETIKGKRILLQCASANRSGGMYGLFLGATGKCTIDEAMNQAQAAGLRHPDLAQSIQAYLQNHAD